MVIAFNCTHMACWRVPVWRSDAATGRPGLPKAWEQGTIEHTLFSSSLFFPPPSVLHFSFSFFFFFPPLFFFLAPTVCLNQGLLMEFPL